ncbi:hypothetical protein FA10DRAFT_198203 [Acaromyces ingoldii]|uniref:Uncharacterized protein n=1 Tax=Acaromyces ingoldii TaxID=215250 RepID=A0A316YCL7_9BASI|nr:hypothetical protein FA10DRAFT_198203 [Acaromyces ingoldii]PWN87217.1 hypothetical protein FA10DRAFT_198203 [Acaromyces ingoldii]
MRSHCSSHLLILFLLLVTLSSVLFLSASALPVPETQHRKRLAVNSNTGTPISISTDPSNPVIKTKSPVAAGSSKVHRRRGLDTRDTTPATPSQSGPPFYPITNSHSEFRAGSNRDVHRRSPDLLADGSAAAELAGKKRSNNDYDLVKRSPWSKDGIEKFCESTLSCGRLKGLGKRLMLSHPSPVKSCLRDLGNCSPLKRLESWFKRSPPSANSVTPKSEMAKRDGPTAGREDPCNRSPFGCPLPPRKELVERSPPGNKPSTPKIEPDLPKPYLPHFPEPGLDCQKHPEFCQRRKREELVERSPPAYKPSESDHTNEDREYVRQPSSRFSNQDCVSC